MENLKIEFNKEKFMFEINSYFLNKLIKIKIYNI